MEVIKRYPEIEELLFSIDRIANNLDEMTEIMKESVNVRPEIAKPNFDPEILRKEIQGLKLETDRLNKREDLMYDFICSISCVRKICSECKLNRPDKFELGAKCAYLQGPKGLEYIRNEAYNLIKKLEEL